jgi:hypothetical protein
MQPESQPSSSTGEKSASKPKRDLIRVETHKYPRSVIEEHQKRMVEDRAYAEAFLKHSFPAGKKFTVVLECVDPFAVQKFFEAIYSHPTEEQLKEHESYGTQAVVKTVQGCKVMAIVGEDLNSKIASVRAFLNNKPQ